jgi:hypothetical protein
MDFWNEDGEVAKTYRDSELDVSVDHSKQNYSVKGDVMLKAGRRTHSEERTIQVEER